MSDQKVRHYLIDDLAYSYAFEEAFRYLDTITIFDSLEVVDLIRLFEVTEYEKDIKSLTEKAASVVRQNHEKIKAIKKSLSLHFSGLDNESFKKDLESLKEKEWHLVSKYIEAFSIFGKKNNVDDDSVHAALKEHLIPVTCIIRNEYLSSRFEKAVKNHFEDSENAVEYYVATYDEASHNGGTSASYFLPKLTEQKMNEFIEKYLNYKYLSTNILHCLYYHKNSPSTYEITAITKARVKRKLKEENDSLMKGNLVYDQSYNIRIVPDQSEAVLHKKEGKTIVISYSGKWIDDNKDYPTLLNNLIYLLELVDTDFRFSNLPGQYKSTILELFEAKNINQYGNSSFEDVDHVINACFYVYYKYLNGKGYKLEEIFDWYCSTYVKEHFAINVFNSRFSDLSNEKYEYRCEHLFLEIERLLKTYKLFVKYGGVIDEGVFEEETLGAINSVKSINGKKYCRRNDDSKELLWVNDCLFSDQSLLTYINEKVNDESFYNLIQKFELKVSDFKAFNQERIAKLLDLGILAQDKSGYLVFADLPFVKLLKELNFAGFFDLNHLGGRYKESIKKLRDRGYVIDEDTLFSRSEIQYLNYYLNDAEFSNSLALRNKYHHSGVYRMAEEEAFNDYICGLRILAMIIIKINDDLWIKYPEKNTEH